MTADLHILPFDKTRQGDSELLVLQLSRTDMARLKRRAAQWNIPIGDAAVMLLADSLTTQRYDRKPLIDPNTAISCGLSMVVPGPASLIGPRGSAVRMVKEGLDRGGYKIVPK